MKSPKAPARNQSVAKRITSRLSEFVNALQDDAPISDRFTCKTVILDLKPVAYTPKMVLTTRQLLGASQAIFAQFLGVSPNTIRSWEQGTKIPKDIACRFLDEIQRNPDFWRDRLRESVRVK